MAHLQYCWCCANCASAAAAPRRSRQHDIKLAALGYLAAIQMLFAGGVPYACTVYQVQQLQQPHVTWLIATVCRGQGRRGRCLTVWSRVFSVITPEQLQPTCLISCSNSAGSAPLLPSGAVGACVGGANSLNKRSQIRDWRLVVPRYLCSGTCCVVMMQQ